jgi:hydroxypyruvate reductase
MIIPPEKFVTRSLLSFPMGNNICRVLSAAIHSADAGQCIRNMVSLKGSKLKICNLTFNLTEYQRIFVIGAGKAVVPMAEAMVNILGNHKTSGLVVTKDGYSYTNAVLSKSHIEVIQGGHPVPDQRNLAASSRLVALGKDLSLHDLVICLISGGGSALMLKPSVGLSLNDIQETTSLLLSSGASIDELNTVRKHLDDLKAGGLAKMLFPASVISLILSDVIGDSLDMVASGPTVADPTTYSDAQAVLNKYQILDRVPARIRDHLTGGIEKVIPETVKPGDPVLNQVHNILVGNNTQTALAAVQAAIRLGFNARLLPNPIQGEASEVGSTIVECVKPLLSSHASIEHPACFIAGGETTVTVKGTGKGGRNQELTLGAVKGLFGDNQMILVSLATDGGDGPTDAAGAVATNQTWSHGLVKGLDSTDYLQRNDSYSYFDQLDDLIKIGPTFTNVNDLLFIFGG